MLIIMDMCIKVKNIKELMVKADESMYAEKMKKKCEVADGAV